MDILTLFLIVVVIEACLYGLCCLMCRERHMPNETEEQSKMTHHRPADPPPHEVDHQKAWSHATDHQHHRQENNTRLVGLPLKSLR
jgi:hypothetical protein